MQGLIGFYDDGAQGARLRERAFASALQAILASPQFLFRLERAPAGVKPGQNYRISDIDLASRLSYFLWGTVPDKELVDLAMKGQLRAPGVLEAQVRRMLKDPRSEALATRFASLWLRLQDLDKIHPDALTYPAFDHYLAEAMRRETELLFETLDPRRSQRPRAADGRLDVRQRAAGAALRHSEHHRRSLPPRAAGRREPPRPARPRQHPDDDVGGRSHLAGAARQVGDGSAAGIAAAAAAGQRAGARRDEGRRRGAAADGARADGAAPQRIRRAPRATA